MSSLSGSRRCFGGAIVVFVFTQALVSSRAGAHEDEKLSVSRSWAALSREGVSLSVDENLLSISLTPHVIQRGNVILPRVCAPIRSVSWKGEPDTLIKIQPDPLEWKFSWKNAPEGASVIELLFDKPPILPKDCPIATPSGDGSVMLHAWQAKTFGEKIRFEPQWYKNTVGYWTVESDYATWDLKVDQPGSYSLAVLQGCGGGQGGSEARVSLRKGDHVDAQLSFQTIDTGHFQNFRWNDLGTITLTDSGTYELRVEATHIAKAALFDVRAIHLVRLAKPITP